MAAVPKLLRRREFEQALENYGLLPERLVRPGAFLLPWVEVLLAVSLFFGPIKPAAGIASTLLFAFATAVTVNLLQGRSIECGCLGVVAPRQISWYLVSKDVVLAIGALLIAIAPSSAAIDTHDVSVSDTHRGGDR